MDTIGRWLMKDWRNFALVMLITAFLSMGFIGVLANRERDKLRQDVYDLQQKLDECLATK